MQGLQTYSMSTDYIVDVFESPETLDHNLSSCAAPYLR